MSKQKNDVTRRTENFITKNLKLPGEVDDHVPRVQLNEG